MRRATKVAIVIVLFSLLALGMVLSYLFTSGMGPIVFKNSGPQEKIAIPFAGYNSTQNSVSMNVQGMDDFSSNATFSNMTIRDHQGYILVSIPMSDRLNGLELTTLTVNLNSTLTSGTYTATLTTSKGGSFVSPSFTVP